MFMLLCLFLIYLFTLSIAPLNMSIILSSAESLFYDVMFTRPLSDIDSAMCYELLSFYVLLKVIISGNPFQLPLHHLFCIWRSNPIRFLSNKWPMAESISDKCRVTEHWGLAYSAFGRIEECKWSSLCVRV